MHLKHTNILQYSTILYDCSCSKSGDKYWWLLQSVTFSITKALSSVQFKHTIIMKIMLKLIYFCLSRSQLPKNVKIISLCPTVLWKCFKIFITELVEKTEDYSTVNARRVIFFCTLAMMSYIKNNYARIQPQQFCDQNMKRIPAIRRDLLLGQIENQLPMCVFQSLVIWGCETVSLYMKYIWSQSQYEWESAWGLT